MVYKNTYEGKKWMTPQDFPQRTPGQKQASILTQTTQVIATHLESLQESQEATHNEYSELLSELPFWIFDKEDHSRRFDNSSFKGQPGYCCFTHAVGLPLKPGFGYLPWFDYQHEFLNLHQKTKYIRIIKATGLGFSEITLYLVAWLAFQRYFNTKDAQVPILTGPRIDLAQGLIDRLHNILMQRNP